MYGAILGDMIGAPYEFDRGDKTKDFPLFSAGSAFTDDTVMTVAVAGALMDSFGKPDEDVRNAVVQSMRRWGKKYPGAGYGVRFSNWLEAEEPRPYGSFGNGSAMRVSPAGWLYDTLEETHRAARLTAEVTHDHPEGIKGAEATASAIFLARTGASKEEIRDFIVREFGYDLSRTCDEIRPAYHHVESCQQTVPEAVTAFLEGTDLEDVIRTAVSLGGDCDTVACIAGSIAEAYYGVPSELKAACRARLPEEMLAVLDRFEEQISPEAPAFQDPFLAGNEMIEDAIAAFRAEMTRENLSAVLASIHTRMRQDGHFLIPVVRSEDGQEYSFCTLQTPDGKEWLAAFTSQAEQKKAPSSQILSNFIDITLQASIGTDAAGFILNPFGQSFMLTQELIGMLFQDDSEAESHEADNGTAP